MPCFYFHLLEMDFPASFFIDSGGGFVILIAHMMQEGGKHTEPGPLLADHPFEVIALMAHVALPAGARFTEVGEGAIMMEGETEGCSTVTTFVGPKEEMAPIISFIYHYYARLDKPSAHPVPLMLEYINERMRAADFEPPEAESADLRRAVLFGCNIVDGDDIEAGLQASIDCITVAAIFAEDPGVSFLQELKELVEDPEFNKEDVD